MDEARTISLLQQISERLENDGDKSLGFRSRSLPFLRLQLNADFDAVLSVEKNSRSETVIQLAAQLIPRFFKYYWIQAEKAWEVCKSLLLDKEAAGLDSLMVDRLTSCMDLALPFIMPFSQRGASNKKFIIYLIEHVLPLFDELPEERQVQLLKNLAESSPYTAPQDTSQLLLSIVQLLKVI